MRGGTIYTKIVLLRIVRNLKSRTVLAVSVGSLGPCWSVFMIVVDMLSVALRHCCRPCRRRRAPRGKNGASSADPWQHKDGGEIIRSAPKLHVFWQGQKKKDE